MEHKTERAIAGGLRRWSLLITAALAALATLVAVAVTTPAALQGSAAPAAGTIAPVQVRLTAAEQAAWQAQTATATGRTEVVSMMRDAFAGVATVGTGPRPPLDVATEHVRTVSYGAGVRPAVATGITGDHFWIIVSTPTW